MTNSAIPMSGLVGCEYLDLHSNIVGDTFRIFVAHALVPPHQVCPAIYVGDGNSAFSMVMSIQRLLAWGSQSVPSFVIGIGYPTDNGFQQAVEKRNRDYVPTDGGEYAKAILGYAPPPGAKEFLRFIVEELQPELQRRYPIDGDNATFVGQSLGGLFGAWALLTRPQTFRHYILASPAISWNNEEVWTWETACADLHDDLRATVFICAGSLESPQIARQEALTVMTNPALRERLATLIDWCDTHGWPRTTELPRALTSKLQSRGYPSLRICSHVFDRETHMSVAPAAISRGLRYAAGHLRTGTD
jgi:uncharacterized protein